MHCIQPKSRNQTLLFGSLENFIPHNHPVRFLDTIVSNIVQSNLDKFQYKGKENVGRKAYSSEIMLKLFLYGYLNSISSSRKLEVETNRNIELKWLLGDLQPDHKTIANYRKDNGKQIKLITIELRKFLRSTNYINGKTAVIDGTKVKANANKEMLTIDRIEQRLSSLDNYLKKYLQKLDAMDMKEDSAETTTQCEANLESKELSEKIEFLQSKIKNLKKAKAKLKELDKKYLSPADPEANLMKSRYGKIPAYNVQAVVDSKHHMIAECEVSTNPNDKKELVPTMKALKKNIDLEPEEVLGDKGYYAPNEIQELENTSGSKSFIPGEKQAKDLDFKYDKEKNEYICPMGKRLILKQKNKSYGRNLLNVYQGKECNNCLLRSKCTKSKIGRSIKRHHNQVWRDRYKKRMESDIAKEKIKDRKKIVEHVFGTIKYWMGQIPLLLRGKIKIQTEMNLYATAYNLKRLMNIETIEVLMKKIKDYEWNIEQKYFCETEAIASASSPSIPSFYPTKINTMRKKIMVFLKYIFILN